MGDHAQLLAAVVGISLTQMGIIITVVFAQLKSIRDLIITEKEDRQKSADEKKQDIRDIYGEIREIIAQQADMQATIRDMKANCDRVCDDRWDQTTERRKSGN